MSNKFQDFFDIDLSFESNLSRDISPLFGTDAINAGIKNAILCSPREKLFRPNFGIKPKEFLFEPNDYQAFLELKVRVEASLKSAINRIVGVYVEGSYNENYLLLNIFYMRREFGTIEKFDLYIPVRKSK